MDRERKRGQEIRKIYIYKLRPIHEWVGNVYTAQAGMWRG